MPIRQLKENNPEQQIQFKELAFLHSLSCVKIQNSSVSFPIFLGEFLSVKLVIKSHILKSNKQIGQLVK